MDFALRPRKLSERATRNWVRSSLRASRQHPPNWRKIAKFTAGVDRGATRSQMARRIMCGGKTAVWWFAQELRPEKRQNIRLAIHCKNGYRHLDEAQVILNV
jgi:hypothetical protein